MTSNSRDTSPLIAKDFGLVNFRAKKMSNNILSKPKYCRKHFTIFVFKVAELHVLFRTVPTNTEVFLYGL